MAIFGLLRGALRHGMDAARLKRTAGRQLGEVRGLARDCKKRLLAAEFGHRAEQGLGIGMLSIAEQEPADRRLAPDWTARCWLLDQPAKETYANATA